MADINALRALWLAAGAEILHETDPLVGRQILEDALLRSLRAYAGSRSPLYGIGGSGSVGLFGEYPTIDPKLLELAATQAQTDHPLLAYHNAMADPTVMTMQRVGELGWQVSEEAAEIIKRLGMRTNQISLPVAVSGSGAATYALVSEDPYTERDIDAAMQILPIVSGLDSHLALLQLLRPAAALDGAANTLTTREHVVLKLLAEGNTANSIATRLRISPRTVHKHQENLYRKLGAVDRLSAVLRAQQCGLLATPP